MKKYVKIIEKVIIITFILILLFGMGCLPAFGQSISQKKAIEELMLRKQAERNRTERATENNNGICGPAGLGLSNIKIHSNRLKNRDTTYFKQDTSRIIEIHIDSFIRKGYDVSRFSNDTKVRLLGAWLIDYKVSEPENCNCYNPLPDTRDIHIKLATRQFETNNDLFMVAEPTRYTISPTLNRNTLFSFVRKKVIIEGYLFFDSEHITESVNTAPPKTKDKTWRATAWEVHPVVSIKLDQTKTTKTTKTTDNETKTRN